MKLRDIVDIKNNLINAFDKALASGDWESTLFFRTLGKRLQALRELITQELHIDVNNIDNASATSTSVVKEGYVQVCISIYQADCNNLAKWCNSIKTLTEYSISRPIYREEQHIQTMIRAKGDSKKEGYVIAYIKEADIITPYNGKPMHDRYDHELLTVKENAVKLENISVFVHDNRRYEFNNGELVLKQA